MSILQYVYVCSIFLMIDMHTRFSMHNTHAKPPTRTHRAALLSARGHAQRTCRLLVEWVTSVTTKWTTFSWDELEHLKTTHWFLVQSLSKQDCILKSVKTYQFDACFISHTSHFCLLCCKWYSRTPSNPMSSEYPSDCWCCRIV